MLFGSCLFNVENVNGSMIGRHTDFSRRQTEIDAEYSGLKEKQSFTGSNFDDIFCVNENVRDVFRDAVRPLWHHRSCQIYV